jgi:hypothetical protein
VGGQFCESVDRPHPLTSDCAESSETQAQPARKRAAQTNPLLRPATQVPAMVQLQT